MSSATATAVGSLRIGPYVVDPPVALAPMAGVTNVAFRQLCREQGGGLFVCEMITSRALVERHPDTLQMVTFTPDESPRSLQLYGIDPTTVAAAVRMIVDDDLADHIDLNFGCPVPKVTRRGGGAALPYKRRLFAQILDAAVGAAGRIPVTVKMRVGIDEQHHTYLDAARIAADAGVAAISCTRARRRSVTPARPTGRPSPGFGTPSPPGCPSSATATSSRQLMRWRCSRKQPATAS